MKRKIRICTIALALCLAAWVLPSLVSCTQEDTPSENVSVTISRETLELEAGESAKLTVKIEPADAADKTVAWKSSDEKIATVKDGLVTAVAEGEAVVTVTAGGKSDSCKVVVLPGGGAGGSSDSSGGGSSSAGDSAGGSGGA